MYFYFDVNKFQVWSVNQIYKGYLANNSLNDWGREEVCPNFGGTWGGRVDPFHQTCGERVEEECGDRT